MTTKIKIDDYITPIKAILINANTDKKTELFRHIYASRKINDRHLYKHDIKHTAKKLLAPEWIKSVRRFSLEEWQEAAETAWGRTRKIIRFAPPPEIVLYPGFGRFNGRVYKIGKRIVIGCSPDFPHCTGRDLKILLAHEYGHFIRWRKTGVASDIAPIHTMLFEEGWAVWLSREILPEYELKRLFMANLHEEIFMPDPPGGYLKWCRFNLNLIAEKALDVLNSKKEKDLGRFFQCRRFAGGSTPIRTGYYLGYELVRMLANRMPLPRLYSLKPAGTDIENWLREIVEQKGN